MEREIVLEGDEIEVLDVGAFVTDPEAEADVWLAGKVLAHHTVSATMFKATMLDLWATRNCVEIRHAGHNLFTFRFSTTKDRDLVWKSGPWFFNRCMIPLNLYDIKGDPARVVLDKVPCWIRAYQLPKAGRSEAMAKALGNSFAGYIDWDRSEANKYGSFFQFRAWIKVDTPLKRGKMLAASGAPFKVTFTYEKLWNFCYRCGCLNHVERFCTLEQLPPPLPFGPWLRAEKDRTYWPRKTGQVR
ncbi:uncharacterized protein LOC130723468 [Lotus japonicus]|uniref:uncharacterized protein LOC130723468 n=1 Tax=Lotus japonicus TaxID=34305 RepID=UPI00258DDAE0|nr:uncharacterized protein LOC130723468 [Lotus japonicus]